MDIHSIVWVILLLKLLQILLLGTFWVGSCAPLTFSHQWAFFVRFSFDTSSLLGTTKRSRLILSFSYHSLRVSQFSKDLWFLFLENGIRNQDLGVSWTQRPTWNQGFSIFCPAIMIFVKNANILSKIIISDFLIICCSIQIDYFPLYSLSWEKILAIIFYMEAVYCMYQKQYCDFQWFTPLLSC